MSNILSQEFRGMTTGVAIVTITVTVVVVFALCAIWDRMTGSHDDDDDDSHNNSSHHNHSENP